MDFTSIAKTEEYVSWLSGVLKNYPEVDDMYFTSPIKEGDDKLNELNSFYHCVEEYFEDKELKFDEYPDKISYHISYGGMIIEVYCKKINLVYVYGAKNAGNAGKPSTPEYDVASFNDIMSYFKG